MWYYDAINQNYALSHKLYVLCEIMQSHKIIVPDVDVIISVLSLQYYEVYQCYSLRHEYLIKQLLQKLLLLTGLFWKSKIIKMK